MDTNISATKELRENKTLSAFFALFRGQPLSFKTSWKAVLLCLFMFLAGCEKPTLPPGGFAAKAVLSQDALHVGDVVTLTMTARHPSGSVVRFPTLGNGKAVVVRGRSSDTSELAEGILESEEIYQITSLRIGNWLVTTNPVVCTFTDGAEKAQALPPLTLKVQSTLTADDATKLSDIKGPVKPPMNLSSKLWVLLLIVLLALIAGLITLAFMRKPRAALPTAPPPPPHILAKQALDALREKPWSPEPFFTELSLILRNYLENRFQINAPESTTEELTRDMAHDARLDIKEQQTLRNFMTQSDLVKFARAGAEQDVMRNAFGTVEQFVEQTASEDSLPRESTKNSKTESE